MAAHRKNYDEAIELYMSGASLRDVAETCRISCQALHKIFKRRNVVFRPQLRFGADNHWHRGGAVRNANFSLTKAQKKGRVSAASACEVCGLPPLVVNGKQRIYGHHDDYNFLLQVRWLCKACHDAWHLVNKAIPRDPNWKPMPHKEIAAMGGRAVRRRKTP